MAVDYFLKIDGIDGESNDSKHKGSIDVESWSWGETQTGAHAAEPMCQPGESPRHAARQSCVELGEVAASEHELGRPAREPRIGLERRAGAAREVQREGRPQATFGAVTMRSRSNSRSSRSCTISM